MNDSIDRMERVIVLLTMECAEYRTRLSEINDLHRNVMEEDCPSDERHCTCVPILRREIERLRAESATKSDRIQELEDRISDRDIEILRLRTEHNARTASDEQEMEWLQSQLDKTDRRLAECRRLLREAMALTPWDFHAGTQAHDTWRQAARAAGGEDDA